MNKYTNILLGVIAVILLFPQIPQTQKNILGGEFGQAAFGDVSSRNISLSAIVSQVVGQNSNRKYTLIQNLSTSTPIFCLLENTTAGSSTVSSTIGGEKGFIIFYQVSSTAAVQNSKWENSGYVGQINCTSALAVSSTLITSP